MNNMERSLKIKLSIADRVIIPLTIRSSSRGGAKKGSLKT